MMTMMMTPLLHNRMQPTRPGARFLAHTHLPYPCTQFFIYDVFIHPEEEFEGEVPPYPYLRIRECAALRASCTGTSNRHACMQLHTL